MAKFKIGEIIIIQSKEYTKFNGMESEVLDHFVWGGRDAYHCSLDSDGNGWFETSLRKKKPPEDLTTWEAIQEIDGLGGWNPLKVEVSV